MTSQTTQPAEQPMRTTVAIALPNPERSGLPEYLGQAGVGVIVADGPADLPAVMALGVDVAMAIVDVGNEPAATVEAVQAALSQSRVSIPVLYVADDSALETLTSGLGESDEVLVRPFTHEALRWRVEAMTIRAQVGPPAEGDTVFAHGHVDADWLASPPIMAVFNPKGGVGKTTIATNLAAMLQLRRGREVLLVDGDTVTGHVALSLGMQQGTSLADQFAEEDAGEPHRTLLDLATKHSSGIQVVALSNSPLNLGNLPAERVTEAILEARHHVGAVLVDLHPSYSEVNLAIFAVADKIIVPVTPDLPAIRAAVQLKEVATEIGIVNRLALVVNRANSGVSVPDIEATTGLKAIGEIRSAGMSFVWSSNVGRTVIEKFPKHKVCDDFERLADRLLALPGETPSAVPERDVRSMLRSLLGRRLPAQA